MHPVLLVAAVLFLGLLANAMWALATSRPHTPATIALGTTAGNPMLALARGLQPFAGRHPDGTSHAFTEPVPAGTHACGDGPSYCHHTALACRCGASAVHGYAVPEVR